MEKFTCKTKQSIYMALKETALVFPKCRAMLFKGKSFSYEKVLNRINQFAFALKEIGVKKDDPVTICLPNIPEAVYLVYAVNQLGAIANIVHPLFTNEQMKENLKTTKSKYLFVLDMRFNDFKDLIFDGINVYFVNPVRELNPFIRLMYFFNNLKNKIPKEYSLMSFYHSPELTSFDERYENDAIYLHSGGTTGKSKIIALSSFAINSLVCNAQWIINRDSYANLGMLATLPMFHGFGLAVGIHMALANGGCDVLMPKFSVKETIKYIKNKKIHVMIGVPLLYEALCNNPDFSCKELQNLIIAFVGGDFIPNTLLEKFDSIMEKNGATCRLRPGYGLTETVSVCSVNTLTQYKEGSVGVNFPNVKFIILDPKTRKELKANQDGELAIAGDLLMNGYRFDDELEHIDNTIMIDNEKYILTGDMCSIDEEGYLFFKSRIKNIIKVNGIPVFPLDIEQTVMSLGYVWEVAITSVKDEKHGSLLKVYAVLNKKVELDKEKAKVEITDTIVKKHGVFAKPKEIVFLERMPHTMAGKIDYQSLKEED